MSEHPTYPDLSELFQKKAAGRRASAKLSYAEKLEILDKLRAAANEFREARDRRATADGRR